MIVNIDNPLMLVKDMADGQGFVKTDYSSSDPAKKIAYVRYTADDTGSLWYALGFKSDGTTVKQQFDAFGNGIIQDFELTNPN